jgi:hypothetical protein
MFSHLSRFLTLRTLAGVTCLAISGAAGALIASDPLPPAAPVPASVAPAPAPPTAAKVTAISDVALARSVLAAFDADPVLKDVNLVVSVVDRSAVVGGPVGSEDVKKRVEAVVRGVTGVESVKNLCFVQAEPDLLMRAVAERLKPSAKSTAPASLPGVALAPAAPEGFLPPVPAEPPSDLGIGPKPDRVAAKPPLPPVSVLGAPVAPAGAGTAAKVSPLPSVASDEPPAPMFPTAPGSLTGSVPPPVKPADLHAAALVVRKSDPRFARLTVELKPDGALFISGSSAKPTDAWDFAAQLRKLPGAGRVAIDPVLVR